jgi:UDP-N-acetylmuramyl pentapeptide phosphotransferase/UDP-N-acetylglucosamine-1-phosphate transferase
VNTAITMILSATLALVGSWLGVRVIRRYAVQRRLITDGAKTPRGGGLAILVVVLLIFMPVGLFISDPSQVVRFALASILIAMIGFVDELRTIPRPARLLAQAGVALIFVPAAPIERIGLPFINLELPETASYVVSVIWIVILTNAYIYMDGIDGLAGGHAVLAGGLWAGVGLVQNDQLIVLLGVLIACASAGFLVYNLPPASIFMGEVGCTFLGFSLAALPMLAVTRGGSPRLIVSGALIVGLFMFDAALTFLRYLMTGKDQPRAYRSHLYQRLVKLGEPPHLVTFLYLLLSIGFGVAGLIYWREAAWLALLMCGVACLVLFGWITYREVSDPNTSQP